MADGADYDTEVIAISGTSHLGKSTLASALSQELGWLMISTDLLARHPGRPWTSLPGQGLPPHVIEHYAQHTDAELVDEQLAHFRRIEPLVDAAVTQELDEHPGVVVEGSALLLGTGTSSTNRAHLTFLVGPEWLIRDRIRRGSGHESLDAAARRRVEQFADRSILYQQRLLAGLATDDPRLLRLSGDEAVADLVQTVLGRLPG